MITSTRSLGSLGGVSCQFLDVTGDMAVVADVSDWIATNPWISPWGRVAISFHNVSPLVSAAVLSSLARVGFYELAAYTATGFVVVSSADPENIGSEYAFFIPEKEGLRRAEG